MHNSNNKLTNSILILIFTLTLTTQAQRVKFANGVSGMFSKKVRPPIIEKLALSDTVGKEWLSYGNKRMETASGKKFAQIKTVLLAYQKWQSFGKFDYYGCYCFTEGMNLAYGRGSPVDEIDSACKRWFTCYQCAEMDATILNRTESREVCNGREQKYNFFADRDDLGLPQIGCKMNGEHDECARAIQGSVKFRNDEILECFGKILSNFFSLANAMLISSEVLQNTNQLTTLSTIEFGEVLTTKHALNQIQK